MVGLLLERIVRILKWLWSPLEDDPAHCPICGRTVQVMPNRIRGGLAGWLAIPRPTGELTGACNWQNGSGHTEEEIRAATAERPWR